MRTLILSALLLAVSLISTPAGAFTLEDVVDRDYVRCGVSNGIPGFSSVDEQGNWTGFDVDICRAVAAATLGDATKIKFIPLAENECFTALLSGEVDILSRHLGWNFIRDTALAVNFVGIAYYDGQGFMVASSLGVEKADDLKKVRVCSPIGMPTEKSLLHYFGERKIEHKFVRYETLDLAIKGFESGNCDLFSMARSQLTGIRLGLLDPQQAVVLPDTLAKEVLAPVVRQGDDTWFNIVKWSLYAMINGEELGISSKNVDEMKMSNRLEVQQFFSLGENGSRGVGLPSDWAVQIVRQVGNYGEIFDKNLGPDSPMHMERGLNKLWINGGLHYAPPIR